MLSYDNTMSLNGQSPSSPTNISTSRASLSSSPKIARLPVPALSNGHVPNGVVTNGVQANGRQAPGEHHIWLVTGPAGCGKSTVAKYLAKSLNLPYIEGDEYHPKANVEKMSNGIPLTDADRWDWLTALREESLRHINAGNSGVVLTCSALKRKYRDVIRVAPYFSPNLHLHFIYLHAPEEVLLRRVAERPNHFMPASMVHSQLDILEPPTPEETDVISVDVARPVDQVMAEALDKVLQTMDQVRQ
ncbi:carbohydrate kinase [Coniochaeta sp. PMI_546]|nr:carbohydrate kinase [Coniochaeta sp. PMI_546]